MIESEPAVTPVTTPLREPTVATPVTVDVQVPGSTSDITAISPIQIPLGPEIGLGVGSTVTTNIDEQPLDVKV